MKGVIKDVVWWMQVQFDSVELQMIDSPDNNQTPNLSEVIVDLTSLWVVVKDLTERQFEVVQNPLIPVIKEVFDTKVLDFYTQDSKNKGKGKEKIIQRVRCSPKEEKKREKML